MTRDQERIAQALEAAREVGDKEDEIKELALQVSALKVRHGLCIDPDKISEDIFPCF